MGQNNGTKQWDKTMGQWEPQFRDLVQLSLDRFSGKRYRDLRKHTL